jgi:hypothetical protein
VRPSSAAFRFAIVLTRIGMQVAYTDRGVYTGVGNALVNYDIVPLHGGPVPE